MDKGCPKNLCLEEMSIDIDYLKKNNTFCLFFLAVAIDNYPRSFTNIYLIDSNTKQKRTKESR